MPRLVNNMDPQNERETDLSDDEIERRASSIEDQEIAYHELRDEMEYHGE